VGEFTSTGSLICSGFDKQRLLPFAQLNCGGSGNSSTVHAILTLCQGLFNIVIDNKKYDFKMYVTKVGAYGNSAYNSSVRITIQYFPIPPIENSLLLHTKTSSRIKLAFLKTLHPDISRLSFDHRSFDSTGQTTRATTALTCTFNGCDRLTWSPGDLKINTW
jgi:hypothetical protein